MSSLKQQAQQASQALDALQKFEERLVDINARLGMVEGALDLQSGIQIQGVTDACGELDADALRGMVLTLRDVRATVTDFLDAALLTEFHAEPAEVN